MNVNTMGSLLVLVVLVLLTRGQQHLANAMERCPADLVDSNRLPRHFFPVNYILELRLDPDDEHFSGMVTIKFAFRSEIDAEGYPIIIDRKLVLLNVENLDVHWARFRHYRISMEPERICYDEEKMILFIRLAEGFELQQIGTLKLKFRGTVAEEAKGLFRSSVESVNLLATRLEPSYARRLFPCFDDPDFKATFEVSILHPMGSDVLLNTNSIRDWRTDLGWFKTSFAPTPEMPVHLLNVVVGKFESISKISNGMTIALHLPIGFSAQYQDMLNKASKAYEAVSKFFKNIHQPLTKIQIVPVDMELGAIGGWGLISMNWQLLSTHEDLMKPEDRNYAVIVLTKMMVRSWLGNLVTVRCWDDLWFVEGLANYVTSELTRVEFPSICSELYTLMETTYSAMKDDDHPQRAHAIQRGHLETPDEIRQWYHSSSYKKSEALFRMLAHFLGKDNFNAATHKLIRQSLAVRGMIMIDYFWRRLAVYIKTKHKMLLDNVHLWTQQAGYPIISVSMTEGRLSVRQESNMGDGKKWPVPISYEIRHATEGILYWDDFVLIDSVHEVMLPPWFDPQVEDHWLKLNLRYQGYYRVAYDHPELQEVLDRAVENKYILPVERLQLLSDSYDQTKRVGSQDFERVLKRYSGETDSGVILLLVRLLMEMYKLKWPLARSDEVKNMLINYHTSNGGISGPAGSDMLKQYTRGRVLYYLVIFLKDDVCIEEVQNYRMLNRALPRYFKHVDNHLPKKKKTSWL